jgi:GDP-D-mannose 3', 5'-epimerase
MKEKALVLGAGGFIGNHLCNYLINKNFEVVGADLKYPEFDNTNCIKFHKGDLRDKEFTEKVILDPNFQFKYIFQLAADMGGAGFIFTGENDADIMTNSLSINLNVLNSVVKLKKIHQNPTIFYSSSACIYPEELQLEAEDVSLKEKFAYPANPDSDYGWEKLISERLFMAYQKDYGIDIRIARFHNIYGPYGTWDGGREKAPAAMCRKVAEVKNGETIEVWGDGNQTRSFLFIEDCLEAVYRLIKSSYKKPINIGSEEMVSINRLVEIVSEVADKNIEINHIDGPLGVRGRNSNNDLVRKELNWDYQYSLKKGIEVTYKWINQQVLQMEKNE